MVHVTEPFDAGARACSSWRVLPLLVLEALLLSAVLWRLAHQLYWKSHPRRVFFHAVLLLSCMLRWVFWFSLCHVEQLYSVGIALLLWANSLLLLCTASIIVQWWCAVSAGRVAVRELQKVKRFSVTHPLVLLHLFHLACAIVGGSFVIKKSFHSAEDVRETIHDRRVVLLLFQLVNMAVVAIDAVVAVIVARKLRARLLAAAMSDDMKKKSVIQMTLLIVTLTAALVLEFIMDVPVVITSIERAYGDLSFTVFVVIKFLVPAVLLSGSFLYIMRRVEQREPVRLVVMPTATSLVDYEECASPCMWCEHHRRYQVGQNKWDVNLMTSISPRTVDSSFRGPLGGGGHAHGHAHGGVSMLGGGTYPAELETPMGWSAAIDEDVPVLTPEVLPRRTHSGRRLQAGLSGHSGYHNQPQRHRRHRHAPTPQYNHDLSPTIV